MQLRFSSTPHCAAMRMENVALLAWSKILLCKCSGDPAKLSEKASVFTSNPIRGKSSKIGQDGDARRGDEAEVGHIGPTWSPDRTPRL